MQITDPSPLSAQPKPSASRFSFDPERKLCQFESVGGDCRDRECQDLHFKDFPT